MEIEDPQGERDSPEALISHAWETEERSSLRSAFRISLPGTRPPSSPGGQSPPHPQDGGRVGPLVHSWLVGNFEISTPSSSLSLYLAAYRYLSLHTQHIVSAPRPSVSAPRPSNLSTRPSNLGSTKSTASAALSKLHCCVCLWFISTPTQALSLYRYISLSFCSMGRKYKHFLVYMFQY